jgi:hypothetical protein
MEVLKESNFNGLQNPNGIGRNRLTKLTIICFQARIKTLPR